MKEKITLLSILGARPQFIKIAPLIKALDKHNLEHRKLKIEHLVVHTGQHYDYEMSKVFFKELEIPKPDYNLGVGSGNHGYQVGNMLIRLEEVLLKAKPDLALVYGDTNSTLAGALVAAKLHIPVAHVEAGARNFNLKMPEEINRLLTDHIFSFLFTPCPEASKNLINEGISKKKIFPVGNIMIDVPLKCKRKAASSPIVRKLGLKKNKYVVLTLHRASNVDNKENLKSLLQAFGAIQKEIKIVWSIHPRTKKRIKAFSLGKKIKSFENLILMPPVSYLDMPSLIMKAKFVLTDSGGM